MINISKQSTVPMLANTSGSSPEMVMIHFQQTMLQMTQSFLSSQQQVMLCYLQSVSNSKPRVLQDQRFRYSSEFGAVGDFESPSFVEPLPATQPVVLPDAPLTVLPPVITSTEETSSELNDVALVAALLNLISERTGYPIDMLEPGLDLESDLGIDSIKRIEILNNFQKLLPSSKRARLEDSLEQLAGARTVEQIVEWIKQT